MSQRRMSRALRISVNAILITSALIAILAAGVRYLAAPHLERPTPIGPGDTMTEIEGIEFSGASRTLLLFLTEDCPFCARNIDFHRSLLLAVRTRNFNDHGGLQALVVSPDSAESILRHLRNHGLQPSAVIADQVLPDGVPGVPMIVLLNNGGIVIDRWIGLLNQQQQANVMAMLEVAR